MNCVSVIIVNWNGKHFLSECLDGLRRQVYRSFSVTVVDNGSRDGSVDFILKRYPEIHVVALNENCGFAAANNIALSAVETPYAALLNNDAVPDCMWLQNLVDALEMDSGAGFAASKMLFYNRTDTVDRAGDGFTKAGVACLRGRGMPADQFNAPSRVFGACAAAALYRMEMLRDIGFFDEDFFILHEDVDLSFRAQLKGYPCLYVPAAVVYHRGSGSIVHDSSLSVYYGHRNLEWVFVKNMPGRLIFRTILPHILYDIAAFCYFTLRGRGQDFIRAKKDALKGLRRAWQKRREIQGSKAVDDGYLWGLFDDRPRLIDRLAGRLR